VRSKIASYRVVLKWKDLRETCPIRLAQTGLPVELSPTTSIFERRVEKDVNR
jgi:hypothetical protein